MEFLGLALFVLLIFYLEKKLYEKNVFKNLDYECHFSCEQATEGDEIFLIETVSNQKWLPVPWLKADLTTSRWLDFAGSQSTTTDITRFVSSFFMFKSYQKVERSWKVKCLKRGVFDVSAVLVSTDLIGKANLSLSVENKATLTVMPKAYEVDTLFVSAKHLMGDVVVRRHLITDPFMISGVREYTPRDGINKIHWSATAKEGRIMVYNNDYTSQQSLCVMLNVQSRAFENFEVIDKERVEDSIRICAHLFSKALYIGMPLSFTANAWTSVRAAGEPERRSVFTNSYSGIDHVHELLMILANIQLVSTTTFPIFLNDAYHKITSTDIYIVTAYLDENIIAFARNKGYAGISVTVLVTNNIDPALIPMDISVFGLGVDSVE